MNGYKIKMGQPGADKPIFPALAGLPPGKKSLLSRGIDPKQEDRCYFL
jgi:hypothetical protein